MFLTRYNPPKSSCVKLDTETKFVDQSEADMVGLKYQLQRYGLDGLAARFEAMKDKFGYADTRLIPSFSELQNRIIKGTEYFRQLPSEIRAKFGHNVAAFYEYIENNPEQAVKDGLISGVQVVEDIRKDIQNIVSPSVEKVEPQPVKVPETQSVSENSENLSAH